MNLRKWIAVSLVYVLAGGPALAQFFPVDSATSQNKLATDNTAAMKSGVVGALTSCPYGQVLTGGNCVAISIFGGNGSWTLKVAPEMRCGIMNDNGSISWTGTSIRPVTDWRNFCVNMNYDGKGNVQVMNYNAGVWANYGPPPTTSGITTAVQVLNYGCLVLYPNVDNATGSIYGWAIGDTGPVVVLAGGYYFPTC